MPRSPEFALVIVRNKFMARDTLHQERVLIQKESTNAKFIEAESSDYVSVKAGVCKASRPTALK